MNLGKNNRDKSYMDLIESRNIEGQTEAVLRAFFNCPDSTSQFIAKYLNMPLASVNGRRNELMKEGLIVASGTKYNESNVGRIIYRVNLKVDKTENTSDADKCLKWSQMKKVADCIIYLKRTLKNANKAQLQGIIKDIKLLLNWYEEKLADRSDA